MPERRLEDLWVRGKFVTLDDGKGPVTVWVQKLSPVETQAALRRANAARARVKALRHDRDSDGFMDLWADVLTWETKDALVTYLLAETQLRIEEKYEAQVAAQDEWAGEGYLQGLRDSWKELEEAHLVDPESPEGLEGARVLAELKRFGAAAEALGAGDLAAARAELEAQPMEALQEAAFERVLSYRGNAAWIDAMHRAEVFYGVHPAKPGRDPGTWVAMATTRYWKSQDEFDRLPGEVLGPLFEAYAELSVPANEGKDSEETPTSSDSSELPSAPAMGVSSGPVAVAP